jgi:hypothetical protein
MKLVLKLLAGAVVLLLIAAGTVYALSERRR